MASLKTEPSLGEVHSSVPMTGTFLRRLLTFTGPAFMVSVGYMDPGNWATDLAGGARFGYRLLWVIMLSNMMAIVLQTLAARLGIVTGRDLAQACRDHYPPPVVWALWIMCEIAIAATDLAEVIGSAIGLHLLFHIPLLAGVVITAFDVMLFLVLQSWGMRKMEAFILTLIGTIGACFAIQMFLTRPALGPVLAGFVPGAMNGEMLYVAIGIIGATVMPHNLYLHSALVQSRAFERTNEGRREATRFNLVDSVVALNVAFLVNAAILILAAGVFHNSGHQDVASLETAHELLAPLLGTKLAPILFAIALLAAGQSSTVTGTIAGQIVMEGFVDIKMRPTLRRLVTRLIAIAPAVVVLLLRGERGIDDLLILSQVVLSLQLSFAIVPLIHFTRDKRKMGAFATPTWANALAWVVAALIIALNVKLVFGTIGEGVRAGSLLVQFGLLPATLFALPLLAWMIVEPYWREWKVGRRAPLPTPVIPPLETVLSHQFHRIGVALEVAPGDQEILASVVPLARASGAEVVLIHAVESGAARFLGDNVQDEEARGDREYITRVCEMLRQNGLICTVHIGAGEPEDELARIAREEHLDLIVTGSHGHRWLGDLFHGSTVSELRHKIKIPVFSIRLGKHQ